MKGLTDLGRIQYSAYCVTHLQWQDQILYMFTGDIAYYTTLSGMIIFTECTLIHRVICMAMEHSIF